MYKRQVKNNTKLALLSKKLATIKTDCKLGVKLEECRVQEMFTPEAYEKISVLEFKSLMKRFEKDTKNNAAVEDKFETIQRAAQLHSCVDDCIARGMLSFKLLCKEKADKDGQTNGQMTLFMEEEGSGKIRKIVNESSAATETYIAHQLPDKCVAFATPIGLAILLLIFDWRLGLLCLIPVVAAFAVMSTMMGENMKKKMEEYQNLMKEESSRQLL